MSKLIYLASPYSHPNPATRQLRFDMVCEFAARLASDGKIVFCPIAHTHPLEKYGLPRDWDFWQRFDQPFMDRCDELIVLCLPGWKDSTGVTDEILQFKKAGKPVSFEYYDHEVLSHAIH